MARIKVIDHEAATGELKEIFDQLVATRGKIADVHMIQSLRPQSIVKHMDLYMEIMFSKSELSRALREMIAVVVSSANNCMYCQIHHAEALRHYWKDENKVSSLRNNFKEVRMPENEMALCEYAALLTKSPSVTAKEDQTEILRSLGWSDAAILDATLVIAYFNFVNRIVLSLGVELETDAGGYNY